MRKYLFWGGTEGEKTRRSVTVCLSLLSLSGYVLVSFLSRMPVLPIRLIADWLPSRVDTHTHTLHTQTPRKTSCSHSGSEIFLPFLTLKSAHGSPCSLHSADVIGTKWPPTFKPADSLWVDGKSFECEIKAKVLHRNNDVYFPVMKHFKRKIKQSVQQLFELTASMSPNVRRKSLVNTGPVNISPHVSIVASIFLELYQNTVSLKEEHEKVMAVKLNSRL